MNLNRVKLLLSKMPIYNVKKSYNYLDRYIANKFGKSINQAFKGLISTEIKDINNLHIEDNCFVVLIHFPLINGKLTPTHIKSIKYSAWKHVDDNQIEDISIEYDGVDIEVEFTLNDSYYQELKRKKWKKAMKFIISKDRRLHRKAVRRANIKNTLIEILDLD